MSIGLYDGDLQLYKDVPFFNIDLMKLSSYYKSKREIVNFCLNFNPQMYSRFLVRQDYIGGQVYPSGYNNVEFGGRAFNKNNYKPMDMPIELARPDVNLYNKLENRLYRDALGYFKALRRAEHLRLSLDGKTVWKDYFSQWRDTNNMSGIIFHDYNLGAIDGAPRLIADLSAEYIKPSRGRGIGMKFPAQSTNELDFLDWLKLPQMTRYFYLQYNGMPSFESIPYIKQATEDIIYKNQIYLNPIYGMDFETFTTTGIVEIYKYILDLRTEKMFFPLIYDKDFFADYRWETVYKLIQAFSEKPIHMHKKDRINYWARIAPVETMYGFIISKTTRSKNVYLRPIDWNPEDIRPIFQFVRENNYELFKLFYEYVGEKK